MGFCVRTAEAMNTMLRPARLVFSLFPNSGTASERLCVYDCLRSGFPAVSESWLLLSMRGVSCSPRYEPDRK